MILLNRTMCYRDSDLKENIIVLDWTQGNFKYTASVLGIIKVYTEINLCPESFSINSILLKYSYPGLGYTDYLLF